MEQGGELKYCEAHACMHAGHAVWWPNRLALSPSPAHQLLRHAAVAPGARLRACSAAAAAPAGPGELSLLLLPPLLPLLLGQEVGRLQVPPPYRRCYRQRGGACFHRWLRMTRSTEQLQFASPPKRPVLE